MKTQQYENIYQKSETKEEGSLLQAVEWNTLADAVTSAQTKINSLVEDVASASTPSSSSEPAATTGNITIGGQDNDSHMYLNSKGNLCIETTVNNVPNNKKGKINIESKDDIQLKPGDDIVLQSDHRETSKQDSILIKAVNGEDDPVELKINASNVTFSAKDKTATYTFQKYSTLEEAQIAADDSSTPIEYAVNTQGVDINTLFDNKRTYTLSEIESILGTSFLSLSLGQTKVIGISRLRTDSVYYVVRRKNDPANVINLNVEDNEGNEGYLKVRAQAIDLRCEGHGGVALQPKGYDSDSHMNKIKFEHGGGDGLEFGTFNTEKTSIFTDEYRFNKNGVWKMATRTTEASDKVDSNDNTTALKYVKQADDFYDIISNGDPQATTEDIIKAASAINGIQYNLYGLTSPTLKNNGVIVVKAVNNSTTKYLSIPSYNLSGTNGTYQNQMVNIAPVSAGTTPTVYEVGRCNILDLVKLVNYFKARNLGPWEASNTYDDPATISDDSSYSMWISVNGHISAEEVEPSDEPISSPGANPNAGEIGE